MPRIGWPAVILAIGAIAAMARPVSAGDDTFNLKLSPSAAASAAAEFSHDSRAQAGDDDLEDVNLRYRLGYRRGYYGGDYILPRFYAFRSGYYDGYYGSRYYGSYYWPRYYYSRPYYYYGSYYPRLAYYTPPIYYSSPVIYSAPSVYYSLSSPVPRIPPSAPLNAPRPLEGTMPEPEPPMAPTAPRLLPEPTPKKQSYRYDGGPVPAPRSDAAQGRLVSLPAAKKYTYPAYGDNRRQSRDPDTTVLVKQKN
jgi:hypothetical protein